MHNSFLLKPFEYIQIITAVLAIFMSILTYLNKIQQDNFENDIKRIHSLIQEENLRISIGNYEISKMNYFSNLMSKFITGTVKEKEVSLVLMTQIDSVLAYNIMDRLVIIQDENIQPALKNALKIEIDRVRRRQYTITDLEQLKYLQNNNRPKDILSDLNRTTTNRSIKDETGIILTKINYCDDISLARLLYEKRFYEKSLTAFKEINDRLPKDKKISNVEAIRIKINIESGQIEKACQLFYAAFKDLCL